MAGQSTWELLLTFAPGMVPSLVVTFIGMVLAGAKLRRHPWPAGLVLAGCLLRFGASVINTAASIYHVQSMTLVTSRSDWFVILGWAVNVTSTLGLGLLIAAAFVGRTPPRDD